VIESWVNPDTLCRFRPRRPLRRIARRTPDLFVLDRAGRIVPNLLPARDLEATLPEE
jgi:hypothetical protein